VANLRRHPRRHVTMDEAFQCTLHIPLREHMATIFIEHYDRTLETYGRDVHPKLLNEMGVEVLIGILQQDPA